MDSTGRFHVAAVCDGGIRYATSADGITWTAESIVPGIDVLELEPQLAVDGNRIHLAFNRYLPLDEGCGGTELRHLGAFVQSRRLPDGAWSSQKGIGQEGAVLGAFRVVGGAVHAILYNDDAVSYLRSSGIDGLTVSIPDAGTASLRVGDDGMPRIAYRTASAIAYGRVADGQLFTETAVQSVDSAGHPELVLAPGDVPYIAWTQDREGGGGGCVSPDSGPLDGTYLATKADGAWTSQRVTPLVGGTSLTLDVRNGDIHLVVGREAITHFVSANGGRSWTSAMVPGSAGAHAPVVRIDPVTGRIGIAAVQEAGIAFFVAG